jgi:hypothetical protein
VRISSAPQDSFEDADEADVVPVLLLLQESAEVLMSDEDSQLAAVFFKQLFRTRFDFMLCAKVSGSKCNEASRERNGCLRSLGHQRSRVFNASC